MSEEELILKAGRIAATTLKEASSLVKPGAKVLDICEYVENRIRELGGKPAFPCNISINYVAAHYSPYINDTFTVPEGAVVKLDIGAQIDGYLSDTAVTVVLDDKYQKLAEAARDALYAAIQNFRANTNIGEIGKIIEKVIKMYGYKPIRNLGGHLIKRYELHAGISIPNVYERVPWKIKEGEVYAIEPFVTDGGGEVIEGKDVTIFALRNPNVKTTNELERKVLNEIEARFKTLPFTERWLKDLGEPDTIRNVLRSLAKKKALTQYAVLVEVKKGIVAQFEHTVLVTKDGPIVTTSQNI
ncbi:MAG: type II methionyl aminopeptidase [Sulfolobaceae archaeon]|nr:type II methionyl aminopeptidase [Sulfolobaceae archaeon]